MERTMLWHSSEVPHVTLLGSIHLLDGKLPAWVLDACDTADLVVLEADFAKAPALPQMPAGRTLFGLSSRLGRLVASEGARLCPKQKEIHRLYPFAVATLLGICALPSDIQFKRGVEATLRERASRLEVLEAVDTYYRLVFIEPPISEQVAALKRVLGELKEGPRHMREAIAAWRRSDPEAVWNSLRFPQLAAEGPNIMAGMFAKRHALWAPRAVQFINETARDGQTLLIVVGCAHLIGPDSFLAALAPYGYHFERS